MGLRAEIHVVLARKAQQKRRAMPAHSPLASKHIRKIS
jgi:hypothetical protein